MRLVVSDYNWNDSSVKPKNWAVVNNAKGLHEIHDNAINIAQLVKQ